MCEWWNLIMSFTWRQMTRLHTLECERMRLCWVKNWRHHGEKELEKVVFHHFAFSYLKIPCGKTVLHTFALKKQPTYINNNINHVWFYKKKLILKKFCKINKNFITWWILWLFPKKHFKTHLIFLNLVQQSNYVIITKMSVIFCWIISHSSCFQAIFSECKNGWILVTYSFELLSCVVVLLISHGKTYFDLVMKLKILINFLINWFWQNSQIINIWILICHNEFNN